MNNSPTDQGNGVFLAHVRETQSGYWEEHILEEHLQAVAQLADQFASVFGSDDLAIIQA
jgi:CRISPR-associated endonuclease/helicase Cas3